jgi:uncharacterized delta-60 repeat protein
VALALGAGAGAAQAAAPGTLDPSFSGGVVSPSDALQFFGAAVQPNGDVIAAGESDEGTALVERLTSSGQPDGSFGSGGEAIGPAGMARAVALQPDGKIVVAGTSGGMFVERFNSNGRLDSSFGSGGIVRMFSGSGNANGVAIEPGGKIVVVGSTNPDDTRVAVAQLNTNGQLDTSFGSGGTEVLSIFNLPYEAATAVAVQPDGKIVFSGYEQGSPNFAFFNGLVVRLTSNGALDPSFNGSGVISYHKTGSGYDQLNAVTIQNDGKIVAAGADVGGPFAIFLRINSNGSYDTSFGNGGEAALSSGTSTPMPVGANGVGIAGGGRVAGAGAVLLNGNDHRAGVWATTATGQPESTFGTGGVVDSLISSEACGFAVAPDGSLIVVGHHVQALQASNPCTGTGGSSAFVARYIGFGPPPPPAAAGSAPTASTGNASAVTTGAATVAGTVNPGGLATSYEFEYGPTSSYGSNTTALSAGSGTSGVAVSAPLSGLKPNTTYHYRLDAANSAGSATGQDATFTTAPQGGSKKLTATLHGVAGSYGISTIISTGLVAKVGCDEACSVKGSLLVAKAEAKAFKLGKRQVTIGRGSASLKRKGTARLTVRLTKDAKQALANHGLTASLKIVVAPAGGGHSVTLRKTLTFKKP